MYDILVVEDDADMLQLLSVVLGEEGYDVRAARDGEEAVRLAQERKPDLVLMDLMLPVESGLMLAERLKSSCSQRVPIIAMSAADPLISRARAMDCFEAWLPKPFSLQTLLHYVGLAEDGADA